MAELKMDSNPPYRLKFLRGRKKNSENREFNDELERHIEMAKLKAQKRKDFFIGGLESGLNILNFVCEFPNISLIKPQKFSEINAEYSQSNIPNKLVERDFASCRLYEVGYSAGLVVSPLFVFLRSISDNYKSLVNK